MKIDAHQHFWKYNPVDYKWITNEMPILKQDRLPHDVIPSLAENKFDGCVAVQARQSELENDFLLQLAAQHDIIKAVVGWVDLQNPNVAARLEYYQQYSVLKGFRHIVQDEPDEQFLLRAPFLSAIKLLHHYHFTYDILVYEKHLPMVLQFLELLDGQAFVLDHLGKPDIKQPLKKSWKDAMYALATYPNLYCKISGLVTEAPWNNWNSDHFKPFLEVAFDAFGVDRILMGSDWPVCLLAAPDYQSVLHILEDFIKDFSVADKNKVLGGNATLFYKIS